MNTWRDLMKNWKWFVTDGHINLEITLPDGKRTSLAYHPKFEGMTVVFTIKWMTWAMEEFKR